MKLPTIHGNALRHLVVFTLVSSLYHHGLAAETPPPPVPAAPGSEPVIVLDKLAVKAVRERIDIYQAKADDIFDNLRAEKKIRYATVILKSYDTSKFDLIETLLAKKTYRETTAKGHTFFCNYAAINTDIPVYFEMVDELRTVRTNSGTMAGSIYLFKKKKIQVRQGGDKTKIFHSAGAALSGFIAPENLATIKEIGKKKKDSEFVNEVNFEVRLQDLNRYYAMLGEGRPIMNPLDAACAIIAMGEKLEKPVLEKILDRNHIAYKPKDLDKVLATPAYIKDGGSTDDTESNITTFKVAKRLVLGLTGTSTDDTLTTYEMREKGLRYLTGQDYEDYLERILIEAPGHI